jgi:adenosylcobinamide-phosphate synthase
MAFGWAAARFDDLVNLIPARLAALWLCLAAFLMPEASGKGAGHIAWRDSAGHASPNAGWPEAAMAGALALRLGGPRIYGGRKVEDAWMGEGHDADAAALFQALRLYRTACILQSAALAALALAYRTSA